VERKKLNIGLIGLGEVAQVIHLPVLESLPELYRIAAVCDISAQLTEYIGDKYNVPGRYTDALELVKQEDLDAVLILNSDEYHAECAIAAANNHKHILIEKPMCLTFAEADAIIEAKNRNGVRVMVGYMRRYAASFVEAVKEIGGMDKIQYARVRDIIGPNSYFVGQSSRTVMFGDIPQEAKLDRQSRSDRLFPEATGTDSPVINQAYRILTNLGSHDLSAMREAIGMPRKVLGAKSTNNGSFFMNAILDYGDFSVTYETGIDQQGRFDAHIEVYASRKSVKVQYDTPYIRHLPVQMTVQETDGDAFKSSVIRHTFTDPYTIELRTFHDVVTKNLEPKTTPEDYKQDLELFRMITDSMKMSL
jgi:predicted dehydrogenase